MARRIIVALACTVVLLGAARLMSVTNPRDVRVTEGDVTLSHRTVTEVFGPTQIRLEVRIDVPAGCRLYAQYLPPGSDSVQRRGFIREGGNRMGVYLPPYRQGDKVRYAIQLVRHDGTQVRMPRGGGWYVVRYKAHADTWVLVAHVAAMFAGFFCMVLAFFAAVRALRSGAGKRGAMAATRWVLLFTFLGGGPLGFILNRQTFGPAWEGYPFGVDITDNKTMIMFLFWLVSALLAWGSFVGRGEERDRLGAKGFARAVVASFIVSLALFLIPHSI